MGYRVIVLDPDRGSPAGAIADHHLAAQYDDGMALEEMANKCAAITTEFENVSADVLATLAAHVPVRPGPGAVAIAQNRIAEKTYLEREGFPTAPFQMVKSSDDLARAWDMVGSPALLKTACLGYDGKGQASVASAEELAGAFADFHSASCVLERRLDLEAELSVVLARGVDGDIACFPPIENVHLNGILYTSTVPARVTQELADSAKDLAVSLAARLEYVGVMAVEMFVANGGVLFVNELAPRPHNSGHFTLDACVTDQFEQQVRALCGLPLGDPRLISPVTMINLLGDLWHDGAPPWQDALSRHGVKLHLYGKHHPRPGRKMGHLNCLAATPDEALALAQGAHEALAAPVAASAP
jgi:5-(carboxyamino)imidazole ribonucleotide synthase